MNYGNNITFRRVLPDDWKKFREIRLKGLKTDPQAFGGNLEEEKQRDESEWRKRLGTEDRFYFAAEENDNFVSVAGAKINEDKIWSLVAVHTLPEARGKGFAQALTKYVIHEIEKRGASTIELMVNIDQANVVHIYEKAGFKIKKTLVGEMMGDGKIHDEYVMEKKLI